LETLATNFVLFLLLLTIVILGIVVYIYLRQEQKKYLAPKDKYDEAWDEFYKKIPSQPYFKFSYSLSTNRFLIFFFTYSLTPAFVILLVSDYKTGFLDLLAFLLMSIPLSLFFLPFFPMGLIELVTQYSFIRYDHFFIGHLIYIAICLLGVFAKNRRVFNFIYLTFLMLLIANIIGCASIIKDIDLSAIN
jgi:hypothetical protein